jgi:SAM-dependent methyltransferase
MLVDLVAGGAEAWESALARAVAHDAPTLAKDPDDTARIAALDALYSLGDSAKSAGQERAARSWFAKCVKACRSAPTPDGHSVRLSALCAARLGAPVTVSPIALASGRELKYFIDVYWCDAYGTYLEGWVHADELAVASLIVRIGNADVVATLSPRLDILPFWPGAADASRAGFSAYVPGRPQTIVTLVASTARGVIETAISLPEHPLPVHSREIEERSVRLRASSFIASAPPGPVLAVGIRSPNPEILAARLAVFGDREVIGLDIHEGIGVDVVGDAHRLTSYFPADHFAIVYSESVLEHLVAPWLFAVECARVLMPGGRAIHLAPWAWPTHAEPNDFWRYSEEGLQSLFTESIGFRTLATGVDGSAIITPTPKWRTGEFRMPTTLSAMGSWIVAEKHNDAATAVNWPYDANAGIAAAEKYPIDGLAEPKAQP